MKVLSWLIVLCGLWEFGDIAAPFVPGFGIVPALVWSHIFAGIILMVSGAWAALTSNAGTAKTMHWIAAIAGVWMMSATFLFGASVSAAGRWNDLIVGGIVFILSVWAALAAPRAAG